MDTYQNKTSTQIVSELTAHYRTVGQFIGVKFDGLFYYKPSMMGYNWGPESVFTPWNGSTDEFQRNLFFILNNGPFTFYPNGNQLYIQSLLPRYSFRASKADEKSQETYVNKFNLERISDFLTF